MSGNCSSAHADDDVARAKVRAPDERFARTRSTPPTDRSLAPPANARDSPRRRSRARPVARARADRPHHGGSFHRSRLVYFPLSHDRWLSPLRRATPRPPSMRERERTEPPLRDALRPRVCRPPPSTATVRHRFDASARVGASARPTRAIDRSRAVVRRGVLGFSRRGAIARGWTSRVGAWARAGARER